MMFVSKITDWLYQGGQPSSVDEYIHLRDKGVECVLSANRENPRVYEAQEVFGAENFLHILWNDDWTPKSMEDFREIRRWWLARRADGTLPVLYTHCAAGINRATIASTFILMLEENLPAHEAFEVVHRGRPIAGAWFIAPYKKSLLDAEHFVLGRDNALWPSEQS